MQGSRKAEFIRTFRSVDPEAEEASLPANRNFQLGEPDPAGLTPMPTVQQDAGHRPDQRSPQGRRVAAFIATMHLSPETSPTDTPLVRVARHAMATRFEVVLPGEDPVRLRAAGEEALREIERLEEQLSPFLDTSEIAFLNRSAAHRKVRVSPELFGYLQRASELSRHSQGAFDLTVGPLMRAWGFGGGPRSKPTPELLAAAREQVGMHWVELDPSEFTVRFQRPGMRLDLGAFGKGLGLEQAVARLRDAGLESALIHGGTSSIYGLGRAPDGRPWRIGLERPATPGGPPAQALKVVELLNQSLSVSAIWGKSVVPDSGSESFGHVIDPRTGAPVDHTLLSAVVLPSPADGDALSTALLVLGAAGLSQLSHTWPNLRALLLPRDTAMHPVFQGWD